MVNEQYYLQRVDKLMDKLRARCLGQDVLLKEVLPCHLQAHPPQQRAEQLAAQLLFTMARVSDDPDQLAAQASLAALWLEKLLLHLFTNCNLQDQTFGSLRRLLHLSPSTRKLMIIGYVDICCEELLADPPPMLVQHYDAAVLELLHTQGLLGGAKDFYQELSQYFRTPGTGSSS